MCSALWACLTWTHLLVGREAPRCLQGGVSTEPVFRGAPGKMPQYTSLPPGTGGGPQSRTGPAASHGHSSFARQDRGARGPLGSFRSSPGFLSFLSERNWDEVAAGRAEVGLDEELPGSKGG